jgi:hypothetical protein
VSPIYAGKKIDETAKRAKAPKASDVILQVKMEQKGERVT